MLEQFEARGRVELSHNIANLRVIQVLSRGRKFGVSTVVTKKIAQLLLHQNIGAMDLVMDLSQWIDFSSW